LPPCGRREKLALAHGGTEQVFRTGHPAGTPRTEGTGVTRLNAPVDTDVSSRGRLAVDPVLIPGVRAGPADIADATVTSDTPLTVTSTATTTGTRLSQTVTDATAPTPTGHGKLSQSHEVAQVDAGYPDESTTLVPLSVGGHDARFSDGFKQRVHGAVLDLCQDTAVGNKDPDTGTDTAGDTGPLKTRVHQLTSQARIVLPRLRGPGRRGEALRRGRRPGPGEGPHDRDGRGLRPLAGVAERPAGSDKAVFARAASGAGQPVVPSAS
jgi:hypothetical protein